MKHVDPTSSSLDTEDKEYREVSLKTMKAGRWFFIASLVVLCGIIIYYTTVVLNILSIPIGIILWSVVIVFCLRGIVDGLEKRAVRFFLPRCHHQGVHEQRVRFAFQLGILCCFSECAGSCCSWFRCCQYAVGRGLRARRCVLDPARIAGAQ